MTYSLDLNDARRVVAIRALIEKKYSLKKFYEDCYEKYRRCLSHCPETGGVLEIGSGAGFSKVYIPDIITSDVLPYEGVDRVVDARSMPFEADSLRAVFMTNVFHHIPDVEKFLFEAQRCLKVGGRLFIIDEHPGILSYFILRFLHHEPFDERAQGWRFDSTGPLSGANGALAWIVFQRDRRLLEERYPRLNLLSYQPHTPLTYWAAGGLHDWCLLPRALYPAAKKMENLLLGISQDFGAFVDIQLQKV